VNRADLGMMVNNDVIFDMTLFYQGERLNLNNYTVKIYIKATQTTPDPGSPTYTATPVEPLAGTCTWKIPHANNQTAGQQWYRVDVVDGSNNVGSCLCGTLTADPA
jgi:hypothetical protein